MRNADVAYGETTLPAGIRSRFVNNGNGITMHLLEAGFEAANRPCLLLLHGFPELAYSWRKVMLPLAEVGFHVVAPDLRGYGRTDGTAVTFEPRPPGRPQEKMVTIRVGIMAKNNSGTPLHGAFESRFKTK